MEIAPGVHSIPMPTWTFMGVYVPNVYLVAGEEAALIDSGFEDREAARSRIEYIKGLAPLKLAYIIVTHPHPDHIGGCRAIKKATGARIVMHSLAVDKARKGYHVTGDILVEDGDVLDIGGIRLEMVYTPGHSPASICIYVRESKILFTGDHILGIGTTVVDAPDGDMTQYIDSLKKLLEYDVRMICPGHGPPIHEAERKIKELIAHRRERERQVMSSLRQGRKTVAKLVAEIYPELDQRLLELARRQVLAHLRKLVGENRVAVMGEEYALTRVNPKP
jgi:glyoxylase-like metal-dependent hydrolase (beta-lactamase superfamily II)